MLSKNSPCIRLNSFLFPSIGEIIRNLSFAEEKMVALKVFLSICDRPRGGQYDSKGGIIIVPVETPLTIHTIPRLLLEREILTVAFKLHLSDKQAHFLRLVRPANLMEAAALLREIPISKEHKFSLNSVCTINYLSLSHTFMAGFSSNANKNPIRLTDDTAHYPVYNREYEGSSITLAPAEGKQPVFLFKYGHAEENTFQVCGVATNEPKTDA